MRWSMWMSQRQGLGKKQQTFFKTSNFHFRGRHSDPWFYPPDHEPRGTPEAVRVKESAEGQETGCRADQAHWLKRGWVVFKLKNYIKFLKILSWIKSVLIDTFMPFQVVDEMGPLSIRFILFSTTPSSAEPIYTIGPSQLIVQARGKERKSEPNVSSLVWGGYIRSGKGGQRPHKGGEGWTSPPVPSSPSVSTWQGRYGHLQCVNEKTEVQRH